MLTSLGQPGTVLLVGGSSDIATATACAMARASRRLHVVLAARASSRRDAVCARLTRLGARCEVLDLDATDLDRAVKDLDALFDRAEVDVAVVAQGQLPDPGVLEADPGAAAEMCTVNYSSAVVVGLLLAARMGEQGHGVIVAMSSVAGVRPRADNYAYGSTKAGLDAFYTGLRDRLRGSGIRVLVVRPGFVASRMTAGLPPAPLAASCDDVAAAVVAAVPAGNGAVWVPRALGPLAAVMRLLPGPVFRRLAGSQPSLRGRSRPSEQHPSTTSGALP